MFRSGSARPLRQALLLVALGAVFVVPGSTWGQDTSLTPSPDDPDVAVRSEAIYTITFTGAWTTTVTPGGLPGGAHFSRLIGGVHNDEVTFLESGEEASAGVESMAEVGGYSTLRSEINAAGDDRLSILQGTSDTLSPTAPVTFSDVTLTTDHPRVTLVTMIAPSPDWFVGVSGLSMLDSSGDWKESVSVNLYPWDAGTEEGTEFSLTNAETVPQGVISSIRNTGKFNDNKMATLTFTRTAVTSSAPSIDAVHPGDEALTVLWTAPPSVPDITAYDLRWILTSADETVDSNWTIVEDVWTEGSLRYILRGLTNGSGYDVQVRAVTDTDGVWSETVAGTPAEPGETRATASDLPLGVLLGSEFDSLSDVDYYKFTLTAESGVVLLTRGDLDTVGLLYDEDGDVVAYNDDGRIAGEPLNFLIARTLAAGTYYVEVTLHSTESETGSYRVGVRAIADTTGTSDAHEVEVGDFDNGLIYPEEDEDYFQFTLTEETDIILRSGPPVTDTVGELLNNSGTSITENDDGFVLGRSAQFLIRRKLAAGAYYVKVKAFSEEVTGLYSFHVETVTEPGSTIADAASLEFREIGAGRIDPSTDADYFEIELSEATHVYARAVSNTVDIDGALLDSNGDAVTADLFEQDFTSDGPMGFTLADRLDAGTHYIKVTRSGGESTGGYAIRMFEDDTMNDVVSDCSSLTAPFTDPLSGCHWNLRNRGQLGGASGEDIRVEDVWTGGNMGAGIGVAVVDGGLHEAHPDLTDNVDTTRGHDYTDDGDGLLHPFNSHGTSVAGIIAARDNTIGGRGVAPRATVYGYNLLRADLDADTVDAMTRNMATTAVSNNSWGNLDGPGLETVAEAWEMAIDTGVETGYGGKGVVYVWAAGNGAPDDNSNFDGYTNYYGVVAVCAVNDLGRRVVYSEEGANLWVCAPSRDSGRPPILTTYNYGRYVRRGAYRCWGRRPDPRRERGPHLARRETDPGGIRPKEPQLQQRLAHRRVEVRRHRQVQLQPRVRLRGRGREGGGGPCGWLGEPAALHQDGSGGRHAQHEHPRRDRHHGCDGYEHRHPGHRSRVRRGDRGFRGSGVQGSPGGTRVTVERSLDPGRAWGIHRQGRQHLRDRRQLPLRLGEASGRGPGRNLDASGRRPRGPGHGDAELVEPQALRPPVDARRPGCSHRHTGPAGSDGPMVGAVRSRRLRGHRLRRPLHPE